MGTAGAEADDVRGPVSVQTPCAHAATFRARYCRAFVVLLGVLGVLCLVLTSCVVVGGEKEGIVRGGNGDAVHREDGQQHQNIFHSLYLRKSFLSHSECVVVRCPLRSSRHSSSVVVLLGRLGAVQKPVVCTPDLGRVRQTLYIGLSPVFVPKTL